MLIVVSCSLLVLFADPNGPEVSVEYLEVTGMQQRISGGRARSTFVEFSWFIVKGDLNHQCIN